MRFLEQRFQSVVQFLAQREPAAPLAAGRGDIRPALFIGVNGFF
jgi:hypothetical protein